MKLLLLEYAFESLGAERVEFRVNTRNETSQRAVTRIGATLEGRLRHAMIYDGRALDDVLMYGIIRPEWPELKDRLRKLVR